MPDRLWTIWTVSRTLAKIWHIPMIFFLGLALGGCGLDKMPHPSSSFASFTPLQDDVAPPVDEDTSGEESPELSCLFMTELECEMLHLVNDVRVEAKVEPLRSLEPCVQAAQAHALDMFERDYFSHDSPEQTFSERMLSYGLGGATYGENIALSMGEPQEALSLWLHSPGHLANILNPDFKSTGIGHHQGRWVQCFSGHVPEN